MAGNKNCEFNSRNQTPRRCAQKDAGVICNVLKTKEIWHMGDFRVS
jgi:hypothetical protein